MEDTKENEKKLATLDSVNQLSDTFRHEQWKKLGRIISRAVELAYNPFVEEDFFVEEAVNECKEMASGLIDKFVASAENVYYEDEDENEECESCCLEKGWEIDEFIKRLERIYYENDE